MLDRVHMQSSFCMPPDPHKVFLYHNIIARLTGIQDQWPFYEDVFWYHIYAIIVSPVDVYILYISS
jgi:hypothetical protein